MSKDTHVGLSGSIIQYKESKYNIRQDNKSEKVPDAKFKISKYETKKL